MSDGPNTKAIERAAAGLMEHFDTVSIICTKYDAANDRAHSAYRGSGNWYTRYAALVEHHKGFERTMEPPPAQDSETA